VAGTGGPPTRVGISLHRFRQENRKEEGTLTTFVKFRENNENEGETWVFWLQIEGNEDELDLLGYTLDELSTDPEDREWALYPEVVLAEHDVDVLVTHAGHGYMSYHSKVVGSLQVPNGFNTDRLYKGGIKKLFSPV
jgi:hypothetical protein